ncbi:MAG: ABC transporter substrate-binding protein [Chloroflexi bacterium]|nr:ABC transporter substrate-binding protein [Chloroflexota bacterium]MCL5076156.1 ABC transporter substrate-binding protein [Chloroflexota bacterium]
MPNKLFGYLGAILIVALLISCAPAPAIAPTPTKVAPTPTPTPKAPKVGGVLSVAQISEAPGLDPHKVPAAATVRLTEQMYDALVKLNPNMQVVPDLASSWETPDPKTYIFHLRKGVKFHNGRELTADDVKYSIERILDKKTGAMAASYFVAIDKIETPDPYTVKFLLKNPFAPFLTNLASFYAMIVPKEVVEASGDLQKVAVGTGPFKLGERVPDNVTKLERNKDYFIAGQPYLDGLNFFVTKDEAAIVAALRAKQLDFATVSPSSARLLKTEKDLKVVSSPGLAYYYLGFNGSKPPFNDVRVRQAISYAVDRQKIIDTVFWGEAVLTGPIAPSLGDWAIPVSNYPSYTPNVTKAKELLAQAGYPQGFKSTIKVSTQLQIEAAQIIQSQLRAIGIETEIVQVEWGTYVADWRASNFDMIAGSNQGRADPDEYTYFHFHSKGSANVWKFSNATVDGLAEQGRTTIDPKERKAVYAELQKEIVEQSPLLFLCAPNNFFVYQNYVKDYVPMPNIQNLSFATTWLDK